MPAPSTQKKIQDFIAGPGKDLKSPAQAAGVRAIGESDVAQHQAQARVQSAQVRQAGLNQRAAQGLSARQAWQAQQAQLRRDALAQNAAIANARLGQQGQLAQARLAQQAQLRGQINARIQGQQQRVAQRQAAADQRRANAETQRNVKAGLKAGSTALKNNPLSGLNQRISNMPTPGGIGALALVLVLLVFAIVPVNSGQTRLSLLWLTLLGKTTLGNATATTSDNTSADTSGPSQGTTSIPTQTTLPAGYQNQASVASSGPTGFLIPATAHHNAWGLPNITLPGRHF